jgi:small subunit ribosomal protein S2
MPVVTMRELLEAGIHFGHQTRRWNPKMGRYIFGERNGIYIIDLQQTLRQIHKAYKIVRDTTANGGTVLFVGTKKQAQDAVAREADRCGMYYVNHRWLGGTLTNWQTVKQSVRSLIRLEEMESSGKIDAYPKKEIIVLRKQREKLDQNLRGIKNMNGLPDVMFVIDAKRESIAIREANRLGIPCIAIVDTNADPDVVPVPVPGNDDAIRAINLFCSVIANAVIDGRTRAEKVEADTPDLRRRTRDQGLPPAPQAPPPPVPGTEVEVSTDDSEPQNIPSALEDDEAATAAQSSIS